MSVCIPPAPVELVCDPDALCEPGLTPSAPYRLPDGETCAGLLVAEPGELQTLTVDPAEVAYVSSWGFFVVVGLWAIGYGISAGLKVIRLV
ncbi:hypothetical protein ABT392_16835 [Paucibacter sp. JuS9]|uniref:hypothetical protein n=1 Tax=Paucibacter sp. JuS9 TaxID=3228748 RepID=UPI00375634A4